MTATDICPACGYPMVDVDLCAYCAPVNGEHSFESLDVMGRPRFLPRLPVSLDHSECEVAEPNQALVGGVACTPVNSADVPEPQPLPPPVSNRFEVVTFL